MQKEEKKTKNKNLRFCSKKKTKKENEEYEEGEKKKKNSKQTMKKKKNMKKKEEYKEKECLLLAWKDRRKPVRQGRESNPQPRAWKLHYPVLCLVL
ncbi:hypothetical protein M8J75_003905 [Diaphorina citri]|nr:hypothetical protein M8J75_003905 [Diaphorina citri]